MRLLLVLREKGRGFEGPVTDSFMDRLLVEVESEGTRDLDFVGSRGAMVRVAMWSWMGED